MHSAGPANGFMMSATPAYQHQQMQSAINDVTANQPTKVGNVPTPGTASNLATTGGTGGTPNSAAIDGLMSQYDIQRGLYQGDQTMATNNQNADLQGSQNDFNTQSKTYNDQFNQGNAQLDQQTHVLNDSYQRSLNQLANNMRTQNQGFQNSLGINGAGDSSAGQMGAYALANEQNINRGYMNTDLNNQLDQIALQRSGLKQNYDDEQGQLQNQYDDQRRQIIQQYGQVLSDINKNIQGTNISKASAMAYLQQWGATQLQNLDQQAMQTAKGIDQKYGSLVAQNPGLTYQPNYQAQTITPQTVAAQQGTSQQSAPSAPLLAPGATNNNQNTVPLASPNYNQNNQFNSAY
jgi:hypothetical protein